MTEPSSAHAEDLAARLAAGQVDADVVRWMQRGFSTWARAGGALPLERALGLLTTDGQRRRRRRNHWLAVAARELAGTTDATPARALHEALRRFIERGYWRAWRCLTTPPEGASQLHSALFEAARAGGGRVVSVRRLEEILPAGNWPEKPRADAGTMHGMEAPNTTIGG